MKDMNLLILLLSLILLADDVLSDQQHLEFLQIDSRVKAYLQSQVKLPTSKASGNDIQYLQNSNKIGLGYNILYGNPVCYTGTCQMEGFAQPVFKLNYIQHPQGACTSKIIPEHVHLDCLPSTEVQAGTEIISTLQQLQESTMKGIEISGDAKYLKHSLSYKYSSQTRYMIDNLVKTNSEVLYTTAKVSYVKLSAFAPFLNLSDPFRYVIENLPCCNFTDTDVEQYINENIFNYFGFAYVSTLMLGGVAQQNIFIDKLDLVTIEQKQFEKTQEAKIEFYVSLNSKVTQQYNKTRHDEFMKHVKKSYATTLGGDTKIQTLDAWSDTVQTNPIVTKLGIRLIFDLLNSKRFPNDKDIGNKYKLIEQALNKYVANPLSCYNDCSGNGICEASGYFQFGTCKCNTGWSGLDCTRRQTLPAISKTLSGTLCGHTDDLSGSVIFCDGADIKASCPSIYQGATQLAFFGKYCAKFLTGEETSKAGTICGLSFGSLTILCGGRNPYSEPCPTGYQRGESTNRKFCYKTDADVVDLPGTVCGIQAQVTSRGTITGGNTFVEFPCDGYYPGRGSCPPGYTLRSGQGDYNFGHPPISFRFTVHMAVCYKN